MEDEPLLRSVANEAAFLARFGLYGRRVPAPFPVWVITVPGELSPDLPDILSETERARGDRFRTSALRQRYWAGHGALRLLGECYFGVSANRQHYVANAWGKLRMAGDKLAECSISYSGGYAVVAWSRGDIIGVDAEVVRPIGETPDLIKLHCTKREQTFLYRYARTPADLDRMFLTVWVRKEACVKALGRGLGIAPSSFECGVERPSATVEIEGHFVDNEALEARKDLLIGWARCRQNSAISPRPLDVAP